MKDVLALHMFLRELITVLQDMMFGLLIKKNLKPWGRELIFVDLHMAIPDGYYGRIVCCSSIAKKYGIMVHNGTTDLDY